jgi:hypothetical protein
MSKKDEVVEEEAGSGSSFENCALAVHKCSKELKKAEELSDSMDLEKLAFAELHKLASAETEHLWEQALGQEGGNQTLPA